MGKRSSCVSCSMHTCTHTSEMTVEEWIQWMEEKKKQGMTPEQQVEYERRKKLWLEKEREREEKRKKEEMEKIQRTREKMEVEYRWVSPKRATLVGLHVSVKCVSV